MAPGFLVKLPNKGFTLHGFTAPRSLQDKKRAHQDDLTFSIRVNYDDANVPACGTDAAVLSRPAAADRHPWAEMRR